VLIIKIYNLSYELVTNQIKNKNKNILDKKNLGIKLKKNKIKKIQNKTNHNKIIGIGFKIKINKNQMLMDEIENKIQVIKGLKK